MTTMRDGSTEDMVAFWVARVVENSDWFPNNAIYLALIRHAAERYLEANTGAHSGARPVAELENLLDEILSILPKSPVTQPERDAVAEWMVPSAIMLSQINPKLFEQRYAYYWNTGLWKSDFLAALETQFWAYRDYAHAAGKGKMAFLRDLAEVWIAAATTALVRYADNDKRTWRAVAKMLRHHADMVEVDGLRALPWGTWWHRPEEPASAEATEADSAG
jgi:hypothetical protein